MLGRNWLTKLKLDCLSIQNVAKGTALQPLLDKYKDVFAHSLGTITQFEAKISACKDAKPLFHKARSVPFALKGGVEEALDRLEADGVLERASHSDWAARPL